MKNIFLAILLSSVSAKADIPTLMNQLVTLRSELETMSRETEGNLKAKQAELDLWMQKKLELEGQIQKETLRKLQIDEKISRLAVRVKSEGRLNPKALSDFLAWISDAKSWVEGSLPFRRDQRMEALNSLKNRAEDRLESIESLSSELWLFYESELKMATDNEFRITDLGDGGQKAEVARLGFYTLFAKKTNGDLEQAVLKNGSWTMQTLSDGEEKENANRLLLNMKSKKDSGLYQLPISEGTL